MDIGFIGLGKLGAPCAAVMARRHAVVGYDLLPRDVPGVLRANKVGPAVRDKAFVFVAVPTPHAADYDGSRPTAALPPRDFDYAPLAAVLSDLTPHLSPGQRVVVISTVLPGTCRGRLAPILRPSGAHLLYNPYFIAMGTVEADFLDPEFIVLGSEHGSGDGSEDGSGGRALIAFYRDLIGRDRPVAYGTWEEAEATKVFYNTFISLKLAFVNMIQDVAARLGHMNVDRVTNALAGADRRLTSAAYMRAGMGDGGPCHPRDNIALSALSDRLGLGYDLFAAVTACREAQASNLARFLTSWRLPVVIVGRTYKPGLPYTDGSYAALVAHYVALDGHFAGFDDPLTGDRTRIDAAAVYLLSHGWPHATDPTSADPTAAARFRPAPGSVIVDPWRTCPPVAGCRVVHYGDTRGGAPQP